MAILVIVLFPALSFTSPQIGPSPLLSMNASREAMPEGKYIVYVFRVGQWQEVGTLSYDRFFREKTIDLGKGATGEEAIKIRLAQNGGGSSPYRLRFSRRIAPLRGQRGYG